MTTAPPKVVARPARPGQAHLTERLPPFATVPVLLVAAAFAVAHLFTLDRYGYFGDELYFIAAGANPAWGYVDQPPAVPLIAQAMQTLFPDSVVALRLPALAVTCGYLIIAALIARELGGDKPTQAITAGACAVTPHFVGSGHLLVTYSFDQTLWAAVIWTLARWARLHSLGRPGNRVLLTAGILTAAALQVKMLIPALWIALLAAVILIGPRAMITRWGLWAGGTIATVSALPTLVWQAANGWPQLAMAGVVAGETAGPVTFLLVTARQIGPIAGVLTVVGLLALFASPRLRRYRFLGLTIVLVTLIFMVTGGRTYYTAGTYGLLYAAGAVAIRHECARRGRAVKAGWLVTATGCFALSTWFAVHTLPIAPPSAITKKNVVGTASLGWHRITGSIAAIRDALPPEQRAHSAVITNDYWSASALAQFGPDHGINKVYSPSRGYWYFGKPGPDVDTVVFLGGDPAQLRDLFTTVRRAGTIRPQQPAPTFYDGMRVWTATNPTRPWSQIWPRMHHMSLW